MRNYSKAFWAVTPPSLPAPKIHNAGFGSAKVCWDQCAGPKCSAYELSWNAMGGQRSQQLFQGRNHSPCHTLTGLR